MIVDRLMHDIRKTKQVLTSIKVSVLPCQSVCRFGEPGGQPGERAGENGKTKPGEVR